MRDSDRPSGVPIRYVHDHPGALVHQDHKKLGRIPPDHRRPELPPLVSAPYQKAAKVVTPVDQATLFESD